jgi:hypothetical protein
MIPMHTTGHAWASDGALLQVDIVRRGGLRPATTNDRNRIAHRTYGDSGSQPPLDRLLAIDDICCQLGVAQARGNVAPSEERLVKVRPERLVCGRKALAAARRNPLALGRYRKSSRKNNMGWEPIGAWARSRGAS